MDPSAATSAAGPWKRAVTITNPQGFHMRPMRAFVELASQFQCGVRVRRDNQEAVDGKSIMSLLLLGAEQGTELTVEVEGPDGPAALDALVDLLANLESRVEVDTDP
jgi:phosphotransferase system HPr (HPr) family protein